MRIMNGNMEEAKMKKGVYLLLASLILFVGCIRNEIIDEPLQSLEKYTFVAYTEQGDLTKTTLDGEVGDDERYIMWDVNDSIGISTGSKTFAKFVNVETESSEAGLFEGYVAASESYYAIYPYDKNATLDGSLLKFSLPAVQNYKENSFGENSYPMVSRKDKEGDFNFKNLCGILVLRITGDFSVKSIRFTAKDANGGDINLSGKATVDMAYIRTPEMDMSVDSYPFVILDCGDDGVQLDETESVPFHIVLPVGEYSTFKIEIKSIDGKVYIKEGTKFLSIKRSIATKTGGFTPDIVEMDIDATNLSKGGTANTYIVSSSARYMIDASVIGNGYGFVLGGNYHTNTPFIEPASASLLWEEKESMITDVTYHPEAKMISFITSGEEGNAVIAAKDGEGKIIWSWQIWSTDQPQEQKYVNSAGTFYMMDRNLGATRADRGTGEEWKESIGMLYFWGRKDPFNGENQESSGKATLSIEETIKNPNITHYTKSWGGYSSSWMEVHNKKVWSKDQKTIYDPCPVGYRVATKDVWLMTTSTSQEVTDAEQFNVRGEYDNGWNFYIDIEKNSTAWYPLSHSYGWGGGYNGVNQDWNRIWTANNVDEISPDHNTNVYVFGYKQNAVSPYGEAANGEAHPVRCMKDGNAINISLPVTEISGVANITSNSATILASVVTAGNGEITERGIVVGQTADLTLENGTKYSSGTGLGEFSVDLTDLTSLTRYYVKAYATNADGTSYSSVQSFKTMYEGEETDLSVNGTANSYVISEVGKYIFDGRYKGNSEESIGSPSSVEVLWRAKSTGVAVGEEFMIETVTLMENGYVLITTPVDFESGNAVVAAKDGEGNILWSWHLWFTDQPAVHKYVNSTGTYYVMDRNMGATRGDRGTGEEWKESCGIEFQWGRKDPFSSGSFTETSEQYSIEESIMNPTVRSGWNRVAGLWSATQKTKYDPCPVGYRVAPYDIWSGFKVNNTVGSFQNGWNFIYDDQGNSAWYPTRAYQTTSGIQYWGDNYMLCSSGTGEGMYFGDHSVSHLNNNDYGHIRCMKDE